MSIDQILSKVLRENCCEFRVRMFCILYCQLFAYISNIANIFPPSKMFAKKLMPICRLFLLPSWGCSSPCSWPPPSASWRTSRCGSTHTWTCSWFRRVWILIISKFTHPTYSYISSHILNSANTGKYSRIG